MVISTDIVGSYKSNYHTIMTTTAPFDLEPQEIVTTPVCNWKKLWLCANSKEIKKSTIFPATLLYNVCSNLDLN
jgi:hypothetical protein